MFLIQDKSIHLPTIAHWTGICPKNGNSSHLGQLVYARVESGRVSVVFENTEGVIFVEVSGSHDYRDFPLYIVHVHVALYVHMYRPVVGCQDN